MFIVDCMKLLNIAKRFAAMMLFVTLFLPLSQCQKKTYPYNLQISPETGRAMSAPEPLDSTEAEVPPEYSYNIPAQFISRDDPYSWLIILAFSWPLLLWAYTFMDKRSGSVLAIHLVEPLACLGSGYVSWNIAFMGDILFWGYVSLASVATYFVLSCYELFVFIKHLFTRS